MEGCREVGRTFLEHPHPQQKVPDPGQEIPCSSEGEAGPKCQSSLRNPPSPGRGGLDFFARSLFFSLLAGKFSLRPVREGLRPPPAFAPCADTLRMGRLRLTLQP